MLELLFIRHAQPQWVDQNRSVMDPWLTEIGRRQARSLAGRAAALTPIDEVLVSPTRRSRETAAPLCEALAREPIICEWLEEIRLPDWRQTPAEAVEQIYRSARKRPPEQWWDGLPGGESFRDFHVRVTGGLTAALAERGAERRPGDPPHLWHASGSPSRIAVIAHGGTNAVSLGFLLGLEPVPWEWERFTSRHASLSVVKMVALAGGHIFTLRSFSDVGHLSGEQLTR